jgi:hypothetical protein
VLKFGLISPFETIEKRQISCDREDHNCPHKKWSTRITDLRIKVGGREDGVVNRCIDPETPLQGDG